MDLLKQADKNFGEVTASASFADLLTKMEMILKNFGHDGEICFRIAQFYEQVGSIPEALGLLEAKVVEKAYPTATMFATRARLNHRMGNDVAARNDLQEMLKAEGAELESFLRATADMDELAPELYEQLPSSPAFLSLSANDRSFVGLQLEGSGKQLLAKMRILQDVLSHPPVGLRIRKEALIFELALSSIALGECSTAIRLLGPANVIADVDIPNAFNFAMANWGVHGEPNREQFERVARLDDEHPYYAEVGPNYTQCLAITHAALRNFDRAEFFISETHKKIDKDGIGREFSAWTFTRVGQAEFLEHLQEIALFNKGDAKFKPRFLRTPRKADWIH